MASQNTSHFHEQLVFSVCGGDWWEHCRLMITIKNSAGSNDTHVGAIFLAEGKKSCHIEILTWLKGSFMKITKTKQSANITSSLTNFTNLSHIFLSSAEEAGPTRCPTCSSCVKEVWTLWRSFIVPETLWKDTRPAMWSRYTLNLEDWRPETSVQMLLWWNSDPPEEQYKFQDLFLNPFLLSAESPAVVMFL